MAVADLLAEYNRKRDFKKTAEPAGKVEASKSGRIFIVQKHDATRLHWDFRLEADGVLKSWAVTKGPSPDPEIKRLAVRTEDHPMAYARFEGIIPAGEYGGGPVMLWDQGTWEPVPGKSAKNIEEGHLHFVLAADRHLGRFPGLHRLQPCLPVSDCIRRGRNRLSPKRDAHGLAGIGSSENSCWRIALQHHVVADNRWQRDIRVACRQRHRRAAQNLPTRFHIQKQRNLPWWQPAAPLAILLRSPTDLRKVTLPVSLLPMSE